MNADTGDAREYLDDVLDELGEDDVGLVTGLAERLIDASRLELIQSKPASESRPLERPGRCPAGGDFSRLRKTVARVYQAGDARLRELHAALELLEKHDDRVGMAIVDTMEGHFAEQGFPLSAARAVAALSLLAPDSIRGFIDCFRERLGDGPGCDSTEPMDQTKTQDEVPEVGQYTSFHVPKGRSFPGFAEEGDDIVAELWGDDRDLPNNTRDAQRAGLLGCWYILQAAADNSYDRVESWDPIRLDRCGRVYLTGQQWSKRGERIVPVKHHQRWRWAADRVWRVVSIRRAAGRPCGDDPEFCEALRACGFDNVGQVNIGGGAKL